MKTGIEEYVAIKNNKRMAFGYTTGTCAAAAACAAAQLLLTGRPVPSVSILTPKGIRLNLPVEESTCEDGRAICAVKKYAGDDPDVTDGVLIYAYVEKIGGNEIEIDGGVGVGRVTKPGLDQPVGNAAINRVPRQIIEQEVLSVCRANGWKGGLHVEICVPGGEELAKKTFNPQLGIQGGVSILGTSGIVEPMSTQALIDTVALALRQARAQGSRRVVLTPGNYGEAFLQEGGVELGQVPVVKCSNFIGDALDEAAVLGFQDVLLVGHAGKLIKLAGGIMNTHSRWADCRTELFCAHAAICGASRQICCELMQAATVDRCIELLDAAQLRGPVLGSLLQAVEDHLLRRAAGAYRVGAVLFTNQYGLLGQTSTAQAIRNDWEETKQ